MRWGCASDRLIEHSSTDMYVHVNSPTKATAEDRNMLTAVNAEQRYSHKIPSLSDLNTLAKNAPHAFAYRITFANLNSHNCK